MRIFLDLDGVLANFVRGAAPLFGREHDELVAGWPAGEYDMTKVLGITEDEFFFEIHAAGADFWADLPPYPYAMDLVHFCRDLAPTYILTRPTACGSSLAGKLRWMQRHFGPDFIDYAITWKKELCAGPEAVLVDDHAVNCTKFADGGGTAIVFPAYNNYRHPQADRCVDVVKEELASWYDDLARRRVKSWCHH